MLGEILRAEGYRTRTESSATGAFWAIMQEMPDMALAKQALAYGAFDFITKPVDFDRLREAVRQAIGNENL